MVVLSTTIKVDDTAEDKFPTIKCHHIIRPDTETFIKVVSRVHIQQDFNLLRDLVLLHQYCGHLVPVLLRFVLRVLKIVVPNRPTIYILTMFIPLHKMRFFDVHEVAFGFRGVITNELYVLR